MKGSFAATRDLMGATTDLMGATDGSTRNE